MKAPQKIKIIFFLTLFIILSINYVNAIDDQTKNTIMQEHRKSVTEIKKHIDDKSNQLVAIVQDEGQKFIDENFKALDNRVSKLINKLLLKLVVGIFIIIILALLTWKFIHKKITEKELRKKILENKILREKIKNDL